MEYKNSLADFEEIHIQETWDELTDRFGFNEKAWKEKFNNYIAHQPNTDTVDGFMKFGNLFINPLLNSILGRADSHPSFTKLLEYVCNRKKKKK